VLSEIIKGDGATVVADEVIAKIDTEAAAGPAAAAAAPAPLAAPPRLPLPAGAKGDVAMPPLPRSWPKKACRPRNVAGTGKDGRVTKGDVLAAVGSRRRACCRCQAGAGASGRPVAANLGDRPEERVPMSRLRARIAERLVQSQSTNAILTTFNEVNMAPVMDLRNKYKDKFEKEHGVKLGFMSFFVKAAVPR
jgi:2-oxoglutarate dehydrogenase E2 component (dihydrolipoamide succinyltransferase)